MKIFKTKVYKVTYANDTGGFDHFYGRYILDNPGLLKQIETGKAKAIQVS